MVLIKDWKKKTNVQKSVGVLFGGWCQDSRRPKIYEPPTIATPYPYARSIPTIAFWKRIDIYTSRPFQREGDLRLSAPAIQKDGGIVICIHPATGDSKKTLVGIPSIDLILT